MQRRVLPRSLEQRYAQVRPTAVDYTTLTTYDCTSTIQDGDIETSASAKLALIHARGEGAINSFFHPNLRPERGVCYC